MDDYLSKPVQPKVLTEVLARWIQQAAAPELSIGHLKLESPPTDVRDLHILLVEDSPDNQVLIRSYLKQTPYRLDIANHGATALELFKNGDYDIILMDMQMPVMDGYEATQAIRAWERNHDLLPTQVIALTALALKEDGVKIHEAGCNSHLTKPIRRHTLLDVLQTCKERRAA